MKKIETFDNIRNNVFGTYLTVEWRKGRRVLWASSDHVNNCGASFIQDCRKNPHGTIIERISGGIDTETGELMQ